MTKDPNFVSVRLPDNVAIWLREYATTNKMVRADKPNMGGSIIAIVRAAMQGQTISNNVGQADSNLDATLDIRIDAALEAKVDFSIRNISMVADEHYERLVAVLAQNKMDSDRETEALKLELETIKTAIAALTSEATVPTTSQGGESSAPETDEITESSIEPDSLPIIEAIANIAAPSIENPLPDETLSDAIAASTTTKKATKRSAKSKFYDGDLASLPVKGELSISSLFGSIPVEYKANHKAGFNQGNIKKDIAIPYIEAYRKSLT